MPSIIAFFPAAVTPAGLLQRSRLIAGFPSIVCDCEAGVYFPHHSPRHDKEVVKDNRLRRDFP